MEEAIPDQEIETASYQASESGCGPSPGKIEGVLPGNQPGTQAGPS